MNRRKITIISIFAAICILLGTLGLASCGGDRNHVDISEAKNFADLKGATIALY